MLVIYENAKKSFFISEKMKKYRKCPALMQCSRLFSSFIKFKVVSHIPTTITCIDLMSALFVSVCVCVCVCVCVSVRRRAMINARVLALGLHKETL